MKLSTSNVANYYIFMSGAIYQPESYEDGTGSSTDREMISKWDKSVDRDIYTMMYLVYKPHLSFITYNP